jgi:hypothetical protein
MKKIFLYLLLIVAITSCTKNGSSGGGSYDGKGVGQSAHDFLSGTTFTNIHLEIQYAPGMKPQDASVNNLVNFLSAYLNKPSGINVSETQVSSIGKTSAGLTDVTNFESANRSLFTSGNTLAVYILFADAAYTTNGVVGLSYKNTSMVLFEKTIQANSGGIAQSSTTKVESGVLEHEFGHLLGLVNNGTPMVVDHEDTAHPPHCNNSNCLMYYETETGGLMNAADNTVPSLDENCINDLKANSGK